MLSFYRFLCESADDGWRDAWQRRQQNTTVANIKRAIPPTHANESGFVLPDGTRLARGNRTHTDLMRIHGFDLDTALNLGIVRLNAKDSIEVRAAMTSQQADTIADDFADLPLVVDVVHEFGKPIDTRTFRPPVNADAVRHWVNSHF